MSEPATRYRLVYAETAEDLEVQCSTLIEQGWSPLGAPAAEGWDSGNAYGTTYRQALWLPVPPDGRPA